jgi:hypothetical protein
MPIWFYCNRTIEPPAGQNKLFFVRGVRPSGAHHELTIVSTTLPQAGQAPEQEHGLDSCVSSDENRR